MTEVATTPQTPTERYRQRLQGLLEETQNPGHLFSWRGVAHLMFE